MGSLLKPFLALTYLANNPAPLIVECRGSGCWLQSGHGRQDIVSALANSCNAYFLELASGLDRAALDLTCLTYGLTPPLRRASGAHLIGLEQGWPQTPLSVGKAFALLAANRSDRPVQNVLAGMLRCSQIGTAKAVGFRCFAKTGTARCSHSALGLGDGYALATYPPDEPRKTVLVMRHNTTGANAAKDLRSLLAV